MSEALFSASAHVVGVLFPKPCYMSSTHIGKCSGKSPEINTPSAPEEQSIANLLQLTQGGKQTENTTCPMKTIFQGPRHLRHSLTLLEYEYTQIISSILQNQVLLEPRLKEHPNQIPDWKGAEQAGYWQSRSQKKKKKNKKPLQGLETLTPLEWR